MPTFYYLAQVRIGGASLVRQMSECENRWQTTCLYPPSLAKRAFNQFPGVPKVKPVSAIKVRGVGEHLLWRRTAVVAEGSAQASSGKRSASRLQAQRGLDQSGLQRNPPRQAP